jgi:tetratricopeptide (TPR) repeat protein
MIALAGIVAAFLLYGAWDLYRSRQLRLAAKNYTQGLALFQEQKYREAVEVFEDLSKSAPSSYRSLSLLYLGNSHIALGEPQKAAPPLERLRQRSGTRDYVRQLGLLSLAYAYEKAGDFAAAAKSFAAAETAGGPFTEESLLGKARTSAEGGDRRGALEAYKKYLASFAASDRGGEISLRVRELEAKAGGTSKPGVEK